MLAADPNLNPPLCRGTDNKLMRSTKSRSRNKSNRQRSLGNIVNRVFDSSGPEGKVRGTPQQIIEKYLTLARDAQLSNDRVAEQSFFQHAEHYTRMLGDALREQAERQQQNNPRDDDSREDGDSVNRGDNGSRNHNGNGGGRNGHSHNRDRAEQPQPAVQAPAAAVARVEEDSSPAAAEPEAAETAPEAAAPAAAPRRPRTPRAAAVAEQEGLPDVIASDGDATGPIDTPEASLFDNEPALAEEAPRAAPRRRTTRSPATPRAPRKKPADLASDGPSKEPASES